MLDTQVQLEERLETHSTSQRDKTQDEDKAKDRLIKELRCVCVRAFVCTWSYTSALFAFLYVTLTSQTPALFFC